jgi:hypothetical protein
MLLSPFYAELLENELSLKFAAYAQIRRDAINTCGMNKVIFIMILILSKVKKHRLNH